MIVWHTHTEDHRAVAHTVTHTLTVTYRNSLESECFCNGLVICLPQVRWYGARSDDPEAKLYVERKVHHDAMSGEESYKASQ